MNIDELRAKADALGIPIKSEWDEPKLSKVVSMVSSGVDLMNAKALEIWNGQSPDMSRDWRIERVKESLTNLGWGPILEHLTLPGA